MRERERTIEKRRESITVKITIRIWSTAGKYSRQQTCENYVVNVPPNLCI